MFFIVNPPKYLLPYICGGLNNIFYNPIDAAIPEFAKVYDFKTNSTVLEWINPT